jgi:hypothetical protein
MTAQHTYDHIANFLATMNPEKILELRAPEDISQRLEDLMRLEKENNGLSLEEKDELDHYIVLERLIRLAKAHARVQLAASKS